MLYVRHVQRARVPRYPEKDAALANPKLLERLPDRWRACRQAAAAAGILAATSSVLSACGTAGKMPEIVGTMAPPAYVTEADAMEIIKDGLAGYMPDLKEDLPVGDIGKPIQYVFGGYGTDGYRYPIAAPRTGTGTNPFIDLFDSRLNIGIEYTEGMESPFTLEPTGEYANQIDKNQACVLVLSTVEGDTAMAAEEKLRKQVVDFLEWLKAQGVV